MNKSLIDWFGEGSIATRESANDYRDAIEKVGELLVASGKTKPTYSQSMIEALDKFGPYIVIAESVALAHAAPNEDVNETGLALLILQNPVDFGDGKMVTLLFGLAATDHEQHLDAMSQLASLLGEEANLSALRVCTDSLQVREILARALPE